MEGSVMETKKVNVKRKLNVLTVKKKFEILEAVDKGGKKGQIAKDFKIPASTLSTIIKDREKIKKLFELKKGSMKEIRIAGYPDLEECLIKWFKQCRDCNLPIGGNELKEKVEQFAKKLGHRDFKSSNGWLENFKNRHNIVFRKLCDES
ncbi:Tigger transposable element-derived protein 4 [Araneus ventricosus]|uniref:Tigger transposable element-derived protein 4 n=1 Tax=Araneus ventricosus TaxID=182803 RepID=A0A4Y2F8T4_ARAVE|nr:Tigger transposable element-derived protein 4 [Araneus ventricosus]